MKKNKLLNFILSTSMVATTLTVLPLCSCSTTNSHVRLSDLSKASQSLDENNQVRFYLVLDSKDYKNVKVSFDGDSQGFSLEYNQNGDILSITLKFLSRVNEDTTFDIKFKIQTSNWTDSLTGLKVFTKATAEQKTVNEIDDVLSEQETKGVRPATMSACIDLIEKQAGIDLETLTTTSTTSQWVWDHEKNKVFVINDDGTIKSAPKGYTLNSHKSNIWKMVGGSQSLRLNSAKNDTVNFDNFSTDCKYSQYLRSDAQFAEKTLTFHTGIDTGSHDGFELTFEKDETLSGEQPAAIINTNESSSTLVVKSELNDIEHHGYLMSLKVSQLPENDGTYTEYGTVAGQVELLDGTFETKPDSVVNDVVISSNNVEAVIVAENTVGAVVTTKDVTKKASEFVEAASEEEKKEIVGDDKAKDPAELARYQGGLGTDRSPYAIANVQQLINCQNDVNLNGKNSCHFILANDIDLNGTTEFTGIGTSSAKFSGTFNGYGYTISNLKITGSYSEETFGFGLFAYTNGTSNSQFESLEGQKGIWNNTDKKIIDENIAESNYSTVIKNIVLDKVNIHVDTDARSAGAVIGVCQNTYVSNCVVKSGSIHATKAVGGIIGAMCGSICTNCMVGTTEETIDTVTVEGDEYNIGGIVGACDYHTDVTGTCNGIVKCTTGSNCTVTVTDCKGGRIAGIVAYYDVTNVVAIEGCINNAKVESKDTGGFDDACIAGIAVREHTSLIANCVNNGTISVEGTSTVQNAAGILACPGNTKLYNCINRGKVIARATNSVAGVVAGCDNAGLPLHIGDDIEFEISSCWNESTTISNPLDETKKSDICDKVIGLTFADTTFQNAEQVSNIIKNAGDTATQINFKNCTLTDPSGSITLPTSVSTIVSDKPICANITINSNFDQINIFIPNQNITVTQQSDCVVNSYSTNNTITIANGASVKSVKVCGAGSKIINNGEIKGTMEVSGEASESTNNGTCRNIRFGNSTEYVKQEVTFTNIGTIKCVGSTSEENNNVISVHTLISRPNITIKNYGIIQYQNNGLATPGNFISYDILQGPGYLWNYGQVTLECYENSQTITDTHNFFNSYSSLPYSYCYANLKWQSGSTINDNGLTTFSQIQDYYKNTVSTQVNITVEQI